MSKEQTVNPWKESQKIDAQRMMDLAAALARKIEAEEAADLKAKQQDIALQESRAAERAKILGQLEDTSTNLTNAQIRQINESVHAFLG